MTINYRYTVVALVLITFSVQAQEDQEFTTVKWRCFSELDYRLALLDGHHPRGKGLIQLSQTTVDGAPNGVGTVTIGGVTYRSTFVIYGLNRHWDYTSNGQRFGFLVTPSGVSAAYHFSNDKIQDLGTYLQ